MPADVDLDDLVGAGLVGVAIAAKRYVPGPASFASYARRRIYGEMIEMLRERDVLARGSRKMAIEAAATRRAMTEELGRIPSDEEIAERLGVPVHVARERVRLIGVRWPESLDSIAESDLRVAATIPTPEEEALNNERVREFRAALERLPERLRRVIREHAERGISHRAIGVSLGVTESRACQMYKEAVRPLREALEQE